MRRVRRAAALNASLCAPAPGSAFSLGEAIGSLSDVAPKKKTKKSCNSGYIVFMVFLRNSKASDILFLLYISLKKTKDFSFPLEECGGH